MNKVTWTVSALDMYEDNLVSDCCGGMKYSDYDICPICKDHTTWIYESERLGEACNVNNNNNKE